MTCKLFFNPISELVDIFNNLFPQKNVEIILGHQFSKDEAGALGVTVFCVDGSHQILISADLQVGDMAEIIAHELAHVAAGADAEHGPQFDAALDMIQEAYAAVLDQIMFGQAGLVAVVQRVHEAIAA